MLGGLVVALLAKWAPVIRGHGIPEAMEAVLSRESRVSPRAAVAKPTSAAVAIGTGGPFGAEGPIIVTGGALGSLDRAGAARVAGRAQDPARRGRGRGHGGDLRRPAGVGRARDRALALRVLPARLRSARGRGEHRRGHARVVRGKRSRVSGAAPQLQRARRASRVRAARDRVRVALGRRVQGPVRRGGRVSPGSRFAPSGIRSSAGCCSRPSGLFVPRALGRRLRRDQRHACVEARSRELCSRCAWARPSRGGSHSAPVRRGERWLRSSSSGRRSAACTSGRCTTSRRVFILQRARSSSLRWPRASARRCARRSPRSCSRSSSRTTIRQSFRSSEPSCSPNSWPTCCSSTAS